jgi:glycosyltransferase involved in cell wall biosynthesis
MRIGIYLNDLLPQEGGAHTFEAEILQSLLRSASQSQHTFVLFSHQSAAPLTLLPESAVEWVYLKRPEVLQRAKQKFRYWLQQCLKNLPGLSSQQLEKTAIEQLWKTTLQSHKIDLIWSFGPYTIADYIPYIVTVWDLQHRLQPYFPEVSNNDQWQADREAYYRKLLQKASYIFVGTAAGQAEVAQFYQIPSARVKVIPFPTPSFALQAAQSNITDKSIFQKYQLPDRYLFYPAQFWPHKNHANLLLAIKHLKDHDQLVAPLVFSGSNKGNYAYIASLVHQLGLSEQVKFLGFIPQSDLVALYQNAVALTFVTLFGPDNLPPLEAFALGCPVIASKVSGAVEQLGQAATLIDPLDPEHIAAAIRDVWQNESVRQDLIQRGLMRSQLWTGQDYMTQVYDVLNEFQAIRRCWDAGVIYE